MLLLFIDTGIGVAASPSMLSHTTDWTVNVHIAPCSGVVKKLLQVTKLELTIWGQSPQFLLIIL